MASNELKNILNNLEISGFQAEVYLALLEFGELNYTELSQKTNIKRTTLYSIIEKMENKGLINRSLDKKKIQAIHPQQIFEKFQSNNLIFHNAIHQFQAIMKKPEKITKVKFYKGNKGIQQLFLDELASYKTKKEKILRTVAGASFYAQDLDFRDQYAIRRQEMGIDTRIIASFDLEKYIKKYKKQFSMQKVKLLPENMGVINGRISASSSRISLIDFNKDKSGVVLENKEIADTFIKFFDFVWSLLNEKNNS